MLKRTKLGRSKGPLSSSLWRPLPENPLRYAGLATSLAAEHDYEPEVDGVLPRELKGTLYRNGPGLYDRGPSRKRMLLDGDGMVQAFTFAEGRARYRNRFVRTSKFVAEERAGDFLFPTWSTLAPGGPLRNLGGKIANQAGTTVVRHGSRLLTFDESHPPYALDIETLETTGLAVLDEKDPSRGFNAHWKIEPETDHLLTLTLIYGRQTVALISVHGPSGKILRRHQVRLPRAVYMHDWFVTKNYFIFVLHPAYVGMMGLVRVLAGLDTFSEVLRWRPREGNIVCVAPRAAGFRNHFFETESCWMWHAANAFERDGEIIADFVGSPNGGVAPILFDVMQGRQVRLPPGEPFSLFRRYVIDPVKRKLSYETISREGNYELPFVSQGQRASRHRYAYAAKTSGDELFWSSLSRIDTDRGQVDSFHFGDAYCGEPVFVARPSAPAGDAGWVVTQLYHPVTRLSSLAILDAERLSDGPLASVRLRHHVPLSFHGYWDDR